MKHFFILLFTCITVSAAPTVKDLIPSLDFEPGWVWEMKPEVFKPGNLFEYINGEAELYINYDFLEMATLSFVRADDDMAGLTVDIYDMGTPLNAFGVYSNFRRPEMTFAAIGEQAITSDLNIRFYKDRFFIQLNIVSLKPEVKQGMVKLANLIADKIPATLQPERLSQLTENFQIPNSLKFLKNGYMGQAAFTDVLEAGYHIGDDSFTAFWAWFGSAEDAQKALEAFKANMIKQEYKMEATEKKLTVQTPYHGTITIALKGENIFGVSGYKEQDIAMDLLLKMQK